MTTPLVASVGWTVSHWFYRIDRVRWRSLPDEARRAAIEEARSLVGRLAGEEGMQFVPLAMIGKADVGFMVVHQDLWRHQQLTQELAATALGTCLEPVYSFLSLSEVSEYISTDADWAQTLIDEQKVDPTSPDFGTKMATFRKRMAHYVDARLHPKLPDNFPIVCFYPMAKARGEKNNWYALPFEERKKLMQGHGESGRKYATRLTQLITTATGLDDWEWGVTLFAGDLKAIRDVVYEMRFDEGSAIYGVFGPFYVGIRFGADDLASVLRL